MYIMALTSYQKEKEEKTIAEKEHAEEKQTMQARLETLQSQLAAAKQPVTTVSEKDLELLALQSQLAELQEDKVKLHEALDALRDHQDSRIKSESDRVSIEILWEAAQKVLSFPEESVNTSGYEILSSSTAENSVDMMIAWVNAALKKPAKNWNTAQDDVEKIELSCQKHLVDTIMGRKDLASDELQCISDDSENDSMVEQLRKKHRLLATKAEHKKRRSSCPPIQPADVSG